MEGTEKQVIKTYDIEQKSEEWLDIRRGKITASGVYQLMKSGRKKEEYFGKTAMQYIMERYTSGLITEEPEITSQAMSWGIEHEDEAIELYQEKLKTIEAESGNNPDRIKVEPVGFIEYNQRCGCSPDGVVVYYNESEERMIKGVVEVKCPFDSSVHMETVIDGVIPSRWHEKYYAQIQMNLWLTGAEWCDFVSYDPRMKQDNHKLIAVRYKRDELFIAEMRNRVLKAMDIMEDWDKKILVE